MRAFVRLSIAMAVAACAEAAPRPVGPAPASSAPPSEALANAAAQSPATPSPAAPSAIPPAMPMPPEAKFVDAPAPALSLDLCDKVVVAVTSGAVTALGEKLAPGDALLVEWPDPFPLEGNGTAVIATVARAHCVTTARPEVTKRVVRAGETPALTWAGGKMTAHLDFEADVLPELYLGRLAGTMPVAEHTHPGTWEVLCAISARGTLRLAGEGRRVESRSCIAVPPDTDHAWQPDSGTELVAVQLYAPPGPEQRFKKLAADAAAPPE